MDGTTTEKIEEAKIAAFEERLVTGLNEAAMMLMLSVGHRTGLLDRIVDTGPTDCPGLARASALNERYVREWLGAMVGAGVVELEDGRYRLPAAHAALLTRGGRANLAAMAQYIPLLGTVEDDIVACFQNGGGVPYERYGRFHEIMAEDSAQTVLPALIGSILPLAPGMIEDLRAGADVADIGCGRGRALMLLARSFPESRFTGYDLSASAIDWARREVLAQRLTNLRFEQRDLSDFEDSAPEAAFDLVTGFDAIHDQKRPLSVLRGVRRSLKPDGVFIAQDVQGASHHHGDKDHPLATLLYTVSCMHCTPVSLGQGGVGLGAMWGRQMALSYFQEAGFADIQVHELPHDIQNFYYVCRG
jgi:SAM-dependent methyltransferase